MNVHNAPKEKLWPVEHTFSNYNFRPDEMAGALEMLGIWVNHTGHQKGFWDPHVDHSISTKLMKTIGELAQGFEEYRSGDKPSNKIPGHSEFAEELGDAVILIFDLARELGFDLPAAIISKGFFNEGRPRLHGKLF